MKRQGLNYYLAGSVSLLTLAIFGSAVNNGFVKWDDSLYVLENPHITLMNADFFRWAFCNFYASNWHPITWISHAIDYSIWGANPLGHHLTSVILHSLNTFLVVILTIKLMRISKEVSPQNWLSLSQYDQKTLITAGVTGLLFGLHPLHVESVAWIAERKDVLCAFFFLLSIIYYTKHVIFVNSVAHKNNSALRFLNKQYGIALTFFILSLLSKPMAVSLPFVLLILDWGLFKRIESFNSFWNVLAEKIPFIALSTVSSIVTTLAQSSGETIQPLEFASLSTRVLVGARSLITYLSKMVLPRDLVPFYPYPTDVSFLAPEYILPLILVVVITTACLIIVKKSRLWLSAWGYYVVTLIPVLGIVQVGLQSMADRYTYLPSLGPFLIIGSGAAWVWGKLNTLNGWQLAAKFVSVTVVIISFALMSYLTVNQIGIWKNCIIFWSYVIEKEPARVPVAYSNRCACFSEMGRFEKAITDCNMAIAVGPTYYLAYNNRGNIFLTMGIYDKAIADFDKAIALNPLFSKAFNNLGNAYGKTGQFEKAIANYDRAIELNPGFQTAYFNRGLLHLRTQKKGLAISDFQKACASGLENGCKALNDLRSMGAD